MMNIELDEFLGFMKTLIAVVFCVREKIQNKLKSWQNQNGGLDYIFAVSPTPTLYDNRSGVKTAFLLNTAHAILFLTFHFVVG